MADSAEHWRSLVTNSTRIFTIVLVVCFLIGAASADDFRCPEMTELIEENVDDARNIRYCLSADRKVEGTVQYIRKSDRTIESEMSYQNGVRHGRTSVYFPNGDLRVVELHHNGKKIDSMLSLRELQRIASESTVKMKNHGGNTRWFVEDQNSIVFENVIHAPWSWIPWLAPNALKRSSQSPLVCNLFRLDYTEFSSITIRYVNSNGKVLARGKVTDDDCTNSISKPDG